MKIQGNDDLLGRVRLEPQASPSVTAPGGFGEILKQRMDATPASGSTTASGCAVPVARCRPMEQAAGGSMTARLEGFLDLIEEYQIKLADSRVSLKGLEPVVRSLELERDALSPLLGRLPEGDGLKDILNQALATTEIEIMRFRRGDYLPA